MYSRTRNEDGSYNSRCMDCLLTIAFSMEKEEDLETREGGHFCPEKALRELLAEKKQSAEKARAN